MKSVLHIIYNIIDLHNNIIPVVRAVKVNGIGRIRLQLSGGGRNEMGFSEKKDFGLLKFFLVL